MSQVASGYTLSSELLSHVGELARVRDYATFWNELNSKAQEIEPGYPYSGYVVAVTTVFLEEEGISLLPTLSNSPARALENAEITPVACVSGVDRERTLEAMSRIRPSADELGAFYEEFSEEQWDEAGVAMQEAIEFIARGLAQLRTADWLLIL